MFSKLIFKKAYKTKHHPLCDSKHGSYKKARPRICFKFRVFSKTDIIRNEYLRGLRHKMA